MIAVRRLALLAVALGGASSSCYDASYFDCGHLDARCGSDERCIPIAPGDARCAKPDPSCPEGFRFTPSAGSRAGGCTAAPVTPGCAHDGDPCDDLDPCTDGDRCAAGACHGTPKRCAAPTCSGGVATVTECVGGTCTARSQACGAYPCDAPAGRCANGCASSADCTAGAYCASGKCLPCGDWLANPSWFPVFAPPAVLPSVNAPLAVDRSPSLDASGLRLAFASDRAGGLGGLDLYAAARATTGADFGAPSPLAAVSSPADDRDPWIGDGSLLLFASDRGGGGFDLFAASSVNGVFVAPSPLAGPVNSAAAELHPTLSAKGLALWFASDRGSPALGDRRFDIDAATRAATTDPFGAPAALPLDPRGNWTSPSVVGAGSGGLFVVDVAVPTRPQVNVLHLGNGGAPAGQVTALPSVALTGSAAGDLAVSLDGCALLGSSDASDPGHADVVAARRVGLVICDQPVCGADDGCCPAGCTGFDDAECPQARTVALREVYSQADDTHDYRLDGEPTVAGYLPTGMVVRVYPDPLPGAVALRRFVSNACDGKRYVYLGTETTRMGYLLERSLGYVFPQVVRGTVRLWRATHEAGQCDQQLGFSQASCNALVAKGYSCDSLLGFAVKE